MIEYITRATHNLPARARCIGIGPLLISFAREREDFWHGVDAEDRNDQPDAIPQKIEAKREPRNTKHPIVPDKGNGKAKSACYEALQKRTTGEKRRKRDAEERQ